MEKWFQLVYNHWHQTVRFVLIGSACTLLQLVILAGLVKSNIEENSANLLGFAISTQPNFWLSSHFIWPKKPGEKWLTQWLQYNLISLVLLGVNLAAFMAANYFLHYFVAGVVSLIGTATGLLIKYVISHKIIFRQQIANPAYLNETIPNPASKF